MLVKWLPLWRVCLPKIYRGGPVKYIIQKYKYLHMHKYLRLSVIPERSEIEQNI